MTLHQMASIVEKPSDDHSQSLGVVHHLASLTKSKSPASGNPWVPPSLNPKAVVLSGNEKVAVQVTSDLWLHDAIRQGYDQTVLTFDYDRDSVQLRILNHIQQTFPQLKIWERFEDARRARNAALRETISRTLTGKSLEENLARMAYSFKWCKPGASGILLPPGTGTSPENQFFDSQAEALLRLGSIHPEIIHPSASFRKAMDSKLHHGQGIDFMKKALDYERRIRRAQKPLGLNSHALQMILHLTNPDHPMWLASPKATVMIFSYAFRLDELGTSERTGDAERKLRERILPCQFFDYIDDYKLFSDGTGKCIPKEGLNLDFDGL